MATMSPRSCAQYWANESSSGTILKLILKETRWDLQEVAANGFLWGKNEHFIQADSRMTYVKERGNLDN